MIERRKQNLTQIRFSLAVALILTFVAGISLGVAAASTYTTRLFDGLKCESIK